MKKTLFSLIALLLIPSVVNAASINTSFDEETCVLTVSGAQIGHDATVSLFNPAGDLIGFKTDEISDGNYSIDFVLGFDADTTIDITLSNESGTNELSKNSVSIKACEPPILEPPEPDNSLLYLNKIIDGAGNFLEDTKDKKPFHIDDTLEIETVSADMFSLLPAEDQEKIEALQEMLGDRKEVVALMFVYVNDDHGNEKRLLDSTYKLLLKADKDDYQLFNRLTAIRLADEDNMDFSEPIEILYDEKDSGMHFNTENVGIFVIYDDNTVYYDFLENSANQTFYNKSDKTLTIIIDADFDKFVDVYVDDKKVDEKYYTAKAGSTVITFNEEFMKSLNSGEHKILVNFTDGQASTNFYVENTSNPNTGDKVVFYVGTALIAIAGLGGVILLNKKLKRN